MDNTSTGLSGSDEARQIKSRERVVSHGEVFTAPREVNAMLDLVKPETERIEATFLEPACGTGNFLIEIQRRKLRAVAQRYSRNHYEYDQHCALAVSAMYGVELMEDNVRQCRERLWQDFLLTYRSLYTDGPSAELSRCIRFLYDKNILHGDALTLLRADSTPITFCQWSFIGGGKVKRADYELAHLLSCQPYEGANLFSDLGDETFIPTPIREYPIVNFLNLPDYE